MNNRLSSNRLKVIDDFVTVEELEKIIACCEASVWRYGWPIKIMPFARPCWHIFIAGTQRLENLSCEGELKEHDQWGFLSGLWQRVKKAHLPNARLLGVYANGQTFGQDGPIHCDNRSDEPGQTVVVFCNGYWSTSWGGELVFHDPNKTEVVGAVLPKPRRVVIFDGTMPHSAKSPTLTCDQLRMTLAFKTIIEG